MAWDYRLRVDPIACDGLGVCAELLPEWIRLDDWGYPVVRADVVPAELLAHARWAAANCPVLALRLEPRETGDHIPPSGIGSSV